MAINVSKATIAFGDIVARKEISANHFEEYTDNTLNVSPIIGIAFRPTNFMQIRVFGGYQFSSKIDLAGIEKENIEGAVFGIGIFFGAFNY